MADKRGRWMSRRFLRVKIDHQVSRDRRQSHTTFMYKKTRRIENRIFQHYITNNEKFIIITQITINNYIILLA